MANGRFTLGKQSGGTLGLVFPDGVSNTEVVLPESGELATKDYVDINSFNPTPTIATGTATFNSTTNNINLTGIGIGVEIGDVIQISGAEDAKNNSEFTIEVITDNNNIIVNQAHANKGTGKNVANRSGDTGVTVKLLAKWYNASDGLGQDWVDVTNLRAGNTPYPNNTNRMIFAEFKGTGSTDANRVRIEIGTIFIESAVQGVTVSSVFAAIPAKTPIYKYIGPNGINAVKELR